MGEISDDTKIGIVTLVDDNYNHVWTHTFGALELRYPHNPAVQFTPGEVVKFVQSHDGRGIQIFHNLVKYDQQFEIETDVRSKWKIKVFLTIAPPTSRDFKVMKENDDEDRLQAVVFAEDFGLVASYRPILNNCEPGVVYRAYITRIPKGHEPLARKVGTVFMLLGDGKKFERVTDKDDIKRVFERCPWRGLIDDEEEDEIGLPEPKDQPKTNSKQHSSGNAANYGHTNGTTGGGRAGSSSQMHHQQGQQEEEEYYEEEPYADDYAKQLHETIEGDQNLGLIVHCKELYSVIWSPAHDLVRVPVEQDPGKTPLLPLTTWVTFRCFPEESQLAGNTRCKYSAYDYEKAPAKKETVVLGLDSHDIPTSLAVHLELTNPKPHSSNYFAATDDFFGEVLCSANDKQLRARMYDNPEQPLKASAIYTEIFRYSKWVVFAYMSEDGDKWIKVNGLESVINNQIEPFFAKFTNCGGTSEDMHDPFISGSKFKPPTGWNGVITDGDKLVDVLGVVACMDEDEMSVIATSYGFARQPKKWPLGTWVRATIVPDEDPEAERKNFMESGGSYLVLKSNKIPPPISTRVVTDNGIEKMLICCHVQIEGKYLKNDYLGTIKDPNKLLQPEPGITAYLVEICLSRDGKYPSQRFWKVLKNHGAYSNSINTVALKLSYFHHELGRTCDDAHSVLFEPKFDIEEYEKKRAEEREKSAREGVEDSTGAKNTSPPIKKAPTRVVDKTSASFQGGQASTSANPSPFFGTSLPYQPKQPKAANPFESAEYMEETGGGGTSGRAPSNSNRTMTSSTRNTTNEANLLQLDEYKPNERIKTKRALGIVVTKTEHFAILYSRDFGDAILLPKYCTDSQAQFDEDFQLCKCIGATFAHVLNEALPYKFMCLPNFKPSNKQMNIRPVMNQFVQMYITCDFQKENIKLCTEGLEANETEQRHYVKTEVGNVLLNTQIITNCKNDLLGKVVKLWVTHVQKKYGCFWQIALCEMTTLKEEDSLLLEDLIIVRERPPGHPTRWEELHTRRPSPNSMPNSSAPECDAPEADCDTPECDAPFEGTFLPPLNASAGRLARNGYGDFLFGSKVPDADNSEHFSRRVRLEAGRLELEDGELEEEEEGGTGLSSSSDSAQSEGRVESFNSDHVFSDGSDDFGRDDCGEKGCQFECAYVSITSQPSELFP